MIAPHLIWAGIPHGNGNTGPPPPWVIPMVVGIVGVIFIFVATVIVLSVRESSRRRQRRERVQATGARGQARVILLARTGQRADFYDLTLEVLGQSGAGSFVATAMATVPLALVP